MNKRLISMDDGSLDDVLVVTQHAIGKHVTYWCIGCDGIHDIPVRPYTGSGASWDWNGDARLPVLSPSQLTRTARYPSSGTKEQQEEYRTLQHNSAADALMDHPVFGLRCHTFVGSNGAPPGHVVFLGDCSHEVRGVHPLLPRREWPSLGWAKVAVQAGPTRGFVTPSKRSATFITPNAKGWRQVR